jgi:hypothetical protein
MGDFKTIEHQPALTIGQSAPGPAAITSRPSAPAG